MTRCAFAAGMLVVAIGSASLEASAATIARDRFTHGVASCQAALPVFDGNIRKRPLGISNEGSTTAFITCGTDDMTVNVAAFSFVQVSVTNRGSGPVTVNCSLVDGLYAGGLTIPKSMTVGAGASEPISWTGADNSDSFYAYPAVSCALPPGTELSYVRFNYNEEIGT